MKLIINAFILISFFLLVNCSAHNHSVNEIVAEKNEKQDPWEGFNRGTFAFNKFFDKYLLAPLAKGYRVILPNEVRTGVRNFFSNLKEPWTSINSALQGDLNNTGNSIARFCLNTTIG